MIKTRVTVRLRPMRLGDVPQVVELDRLCFPTPWPANSYRYELSDNSRSQMFTLSVPGSEITTHDNGLSNWLQRLRFGSVEGERLIGYSGFWHVADEAHISTIGVHPDWRGQSLGELLVFAMLRQSIRLGAQLTTLEVRISNTLAQNLYHKYGFEIVGRRKGYYRDNREDAWLMSVVSSESDYADRLRELGDALFQRVEFIDEWT